MPIDPSLVSHGAVPVDEGDRRRAPRCSPARDRPTAIITGNDLQALGVYQAAREARLHIPEDLSVVGFDDLPIARWVSPPLTTIRQPLIEMAEAAAELVVGLARGDEPAQTRVELATELVVRESTAPPQCRRRLTSRNEREAASGDRVHDQHDCRRDDGDDQCRCEQVHQRSVAWMQSLDHVHQIASMQIARSEHVPGQSRQLVDNLD